MGALIICRGPLLSITWPFSQLPDPFSERTHHRNRPPSGRCGKRLGLDAWTDAPPPVYHGSPSTRRPVFILPILAADYDGDLLIALNRFRFEIQAIEKGFQCLSVVC